MKLLIQAHIFFHGLLLFFARLAAHRLLCLTDSGFDDIESAHAQDVVAHDLVRIDFSRVLGKVTRGARSGHGSLNLNRVGQSGTAQQSHQGGFAGAVASHQADPHTLVDLERGVFHEDTVRNPQGEVGGSNHPKSLVGKLPEPKTCPPGLVT